MARIRSVHPSLFTDEAWVSCSPLARVLYIGLMTDADDQGLFEWKPLQIRMRLLPGDNADVAGLLAELVTANLIAELESGGKRLGAIRYFRRFQRPKKPTATFSLPPEWRTYVGLTADGSEPTAPDDHVSSELDDVKPPSVLPLAEKLPQMEDGGCRREEGSSDPNGSAAVAASDGLNDLRAMEPKTGAWRLALKVLMDRGGYSEARARPLVGKWAKDHTTDELWQAAEAAWTARTLDPVSYINGALKRISSESDDALRNPSELRQRLWMDDFRAGQDWREHERGPKPGEPGCRVAPAIQREFGIEPAAPQPVRGAA